ncbi:unnamed protein product [Dimorphilus gyrociliatus]|uniref:Uncharacterized protein n=1 Tax=Dimorphilus gyrociliatus TaxID=2664684 RepID=A0A7I8VUZ6_9ANNE|nr:unnamed protein product [Dimorphilus gyrociliatus]
MDVRPSFYDYRLEKSSTSTSLTRFTSSSQSTEPKKSSTVPDFSKVYGSILQSKSSNSTLSPKGVHKDVEEIYKEMKLNPFQAVVKKLQKKLNCVQILTILMLLVIIGGFGFAIYRLVDSQIKE